MLVYKVNKSADNKTLQNYSFSMQKVNINLRIPYQGHKNYCFNDLPDNIKSSVCLYVDNCVLYRNIHSLQDCLILQEDLDSLGLWEADWQMKFNVAECHSMRVTRHYSHKQSSISNARKLLVCSFYRPNPDDDTSLPLLNESLSRINPNCKSVVIVGGDFNLGYIDWSVPSVITGKPNLQQHKLLLGIINDHSLTQTVNVPTRQDKILDLFLTNYPSIVNNLETMPPIGESDHDIVFSECVTSLRRFQPKPRKIQQFSKANWDKINEDISKLHNKIRQEKDFYSTEDLWNDFKTSLSQTLSENIPEKQLKQATLPWITEDLR